MLSRALPAKDISLEQGPSWSSFEQFRAQGGATLREIGPGVVGTLATKQGQFRILNESDFQRLYGLAHEIHRLSGTPSLPTRDTLDALQPEGFEVEDVDDLDLNRVPRPKLEKS